ncbi:TetR family transcriptional regulator [Kutzneria albida]|uniref:TetR family transcriptional regulator n=1 Tax=Kutzneria albida TaxID=43357 RepID=UPI00046CE8DE|nr:TetR family transcriptional regulator [Kutzneria albida]
MARPQVISDERLLEVTGLVIGRLGPGFTLAEVAAEAGVAVGTVAKRFGSKQGLLAAMFRDATARTARLIREQAARARTPVTALRAGLCAVYAEVGDADTAANHLAQLGTDLADPELRELLRQHFAAWEAELRVLVEAAAPDLPGAPPTATAARLLIALANGTALDWSLQPRGRLVDRMRRDINSVLEGWQR